MSFINAIKGAAKGVGHSRAQRANQPATQAQQADVSGLFCTDCGHQGKPASNTPGSILIELVLWLCLIVPGLIYSMWRLSKRQKVCAMCGGNRLIPAGSPKALAAKRSMQQA